MDEPVLSPEFLRVMKETQSPSDDNVITVETYDHDLIREIGQIKEVGVDIREVIEKAGDLPGLVHIIIADTLLVLSVVERILRIVKSHPKDEKKKTKTKIRNRDKIAELTKLVAKYEESVDVEIEENEEEDNDKSDV